MKWFLNRCRRHRKNIRLLAAGALPERERVALEHHMAKCAGCRQYFAEIKAVTAPFAEWERGCAHLQPSQPARMRWAKAIQTAAEPRSIHQPLPGTVLLALWRELIWPVRRIWAGFAFVWLMIVAVNLADSDRSAVVEAGFKPPSGGMLMAWKQQQKVLAELIGPTETPEADRPKSFAPRPRSDRQPPWSTA